MKILNTNYREVALAEVLVKTPVTGLLETTELFDKDCMHVVQYLSGSGEDAKYESRRITIGNF